MIHKLFILFIFVFSHAYSQFGSQQIISIEAETASGAYAADIDGDGDKDIITSCRSGNFHIAWFENLDGLGNFGIPNIIETNLFDQSYSIYSADLDNDSDFDVITTAASADRVLWYENIDGLGSFGPQKVITGNADGAFSAIAADLDGDGDNDVISASNFSGLAWYENLDGQGNFSTTKIIDNNITSSRSVVAADLDGDGDLDVVGNGNAPNTVRIFWYENLDGLGNFGPLRVIRDFSVYANVIFVADADGDGDMDVFSASPGDSEVAWHENVDGLGNFGPKNTITNTLLNAWTVYAADLDNDNDIDVLATSAETFGGEVVWFENLDGQGTFGPKMIITTDVEFPRRVYAADIDNDGDIDPISVSQNDDKIAWYENMTIIGVEENQTENIKVYPNPVKDMLNIVGQKDLNISTTMLYDTYGRVLFQRNGFVSQLNFANYASGVYFLKLKTDTDEQIFKVIKE
ncbi:MAG: T9SS type A sorting domain-containing protein [Flavobacteriaceae bacterium]|nr:T9SS type A sorting domain-containing protein [Flavobacteriaceae bacterium]